MPAFRFNMALGVVPRDLHFGGGDDGSAAAKAAEEEAAKREAELQAQYEKQMEAYSEAMMGLMEIQMPSTEDAKKLRRKSPKAITATEPAATTNQAEITQAEEQARIDALRRRGLLSTIQAGETNSLLTATLGNSAKLGA